MSNSFRKGDFAYYRTRCEVVDSSPHQVTVKLDTGNVEVITVDEIKETHRLTHIPGLQAGPDRFVASCSATKLRELLALEHFGEGSEGARSAVALALLVQDSPSATGRDERLAESVLAAFRDK